jgi:hypothetical protein
MIDGEHPTDAGTAFATDDWSQFPAVDVPQSAPPAPAAKTYSGIAPDPGDVFVGWSDNGAGRRVPNFGRPEDNQEWLRQHPQDFSDQAHGSSEQPPGTGVGTMTPPATAAAPADTAAPVTSGEQEDWSQFPEVAPKEHSWLDELAIGGRAAVKGIDNIAQMMTAGGGPLKAGVDLAHALGVDPTSLLDRAGVARPETDNERLASEAITGAATAAPFAAVGGPVLGALASGAGSGAAGEEARQLGYGPGVQLAASLAGGGAAGLATSIPRTAAGLLPGNRTVLTPEMQAFAEENVPALAADVGGIGSRMLTGIGNMTLGGIPLGIAARKSIEASRALRTRIADRIGNPFRTIEGQSDSIGAGLAAQRGLRAMLGEGGTKEAVGQRLYRAIPIAPAANAVVSNSRTALADLNEGLTSNPALSELIQDKRLLAYQRAFNGETQHIPTGILDAEGNALTRPVQRGGRLNWKDLQSFRSYVGKLAGRPTLQDDTSQEALRRLYAGLSEDMRATAAQAGPKASAAFSRANNYWRGLETRRAQILKPLLGDKMDLHGGAAFRQIEQWATKGGDVFALGRALRSMPAQEANDVRATILDRLGTATKGAQDATGLVFSPHTFGTHWNGLDPRAKAVLFPGADYRRSIDNLVAIAGSQKGAQQFANVSKTGNAVNGVALLKLLISNPLGFVLLSGTELGAGAALGSPKVARWLASAPAKPNAPAMLAHINRLSTIAASEPAIANEVLALQERLATVFTGAGSPLPIAAKDKKNGR